MDAVLTWIREASVVAAGFLAANLGLGLYVSLRVRRARSAGLKKLAEAEEQLKEYFGEDFDLSKAAIAEDAE